jgi:hypothetical protein
MDYEDGVVLAPGDIGGRWRLRRRSMVEEHMKVEVDYEYHTKRRGWEWKRGGYAYETDLDLKVGDVVVVPSLSGAAALAAVSRLGTDYKGAVQRVIRRAKPDELVDRPAYTPSVG